MPKEKRGDSNFVMLIVFLISVGIIGTIISINVDFSENSKSQWEKTNTGEEYDNVPSKNNNNIITDEGNTESGASQLGGGSSSSGGGTSENQNTCTTKLIKYSITTTAFTDTCNEFSGSICINKSISCSYQIKNDDSVQSTFDMELLFLEDGTDKEFNLQKQTAKYLLAPLETVIMQGNLNINSEGENGTANQKINCFVNTANPIEEEVCT